MKKKLGSLLLAVTLITSLALAGCGSTKKTGTNDVKKPVVVGFI